MDQGGTPAAEGLALGLEAIARSHEGAQVALRLIVLAQGRIHGSLEADQITQLGAQVVNQTLILRLPRNVGLFHFFHALQRALRLLGDFLPDLETDDRGTQRATQRGVGNFHRTTREGSPIDG